jgi:hypothetical protein
MIEKNYAEKAQRFFIASPSADLHVFISVFFLCGKITAKLKNANSNV